MCRWMVALAFAGFFWAVATNAQSFYGYQCTQDCSGHEAGYEWAARRGITDPDDCGGRSTLLIEGCMAYAEQFEYEDAYGDESGDDYGYGEEDEDVEREDWR